MNIVYAGNSKVYKGILLCAMSIIKHTDKPLNVFILTMDLRDINPNYSPIVEEQRVFLEEVLKKVNPNSNVTLLDITPFYLETVERNKNSKNQYTPYAVIRLYLDKFEVGDKALYLDVDTMVLGDISDYYNTDITEYEFAATYDYLGHVMRKPKYMNSGILLLNLKKIKETNLFERCIDLIVNKRMMFPDQDALNKLGVKKLRMPYKYNEQRDIKEDTVIKHFCKGMKWFPIIRSYNIKQWDFEGVNKKLKIDQFNDIFEEYKKMDKPI